MTILLCFSQCCVSTLKSGGSIFLTTFNKTLSSWLGGIITAEHILKLIPKGTHDWNKFVTPAEMQSILETCIIDLDLSLIILRGFVLQISIN